MIVADGYRLGPGRVVGTAGACKCCADTTTAATGVRRVARMLIASLKPRTMGGTTNTGLLAYALARAGHPVTCYDADESLQLAAWAREAGDFPCPVHEADTPAFA